MVSLCLQGGLIVNNTGSYYPAVRITGMVAGQTVSFDDIEVSISSTLTALQYHTHSKLLKGQGSSVRQGCRVIDKLYTAC